MKEYKNIPPKDIHEAIRGACFDYEDFDTVINGSTIQDRVYDSWQRIHYVLQRWAIADPDVFVDFIKNGKPDLTI